MINNPHQWQKQSEISILRYSLISWRLFQARDMDKSTDLENFWRDKYCIDFSELFVVSHCVYLVLQKKMERNKIPCCKGLW